jgi:Tol biopolymer transport system component
MRTSRWPAVGATLVAFAFAFAVALVAAATTQSAVAPRWIIFSAEAGDNAAGIQQLYRIDTAGQGLQQITTGNLPAVSPAFSPNGARIAFTRLGSGIYTMNVDGSGLKRVTSNGRDGYPVWSPDGKRIAFNRLYRKTWRLYTMSPNGKDVRRLAGAPPAGRPSWTANSKSIIFPSAGDLVRVDSTTGKIQRYYGVPLDLQVGQTASVSPNSRLVAAVDFRRSTGPPDCGEGRCQQFGLYMANVLPPHRYHKIVDDTGAAGWSPDGSNLVFAAKGVLTVREVKTGKQSGIPTGSHSVIGDAPPAWQPASR